MTNQIEFRKNKFLSCNARLWQKFGKNRIYFDKNFIDYCMSNLDMTLGEALELETKSAYYDCDTDSFMNCNDFIFSLVETTKEEANIIKVKMSSNSLAARKEAAKMGLKALKGTLKQKEWSENIRQEKLKEMTCENINYIANFNITEKAIFWIAQRNNSVAEIIKNLKIYEKLLISRNEKNALLLKSRETNKIWSDEMKTLQKEIDLASKEADKFANKLLGKRF